MHFTQQPRLAILSPFFFIIIISELLLLLLNLITEAVTARVRPQEI